LLKNLYFAAEDTFSMPAMKVRKRDGRTESFSFRKLHASIHQAFRRAGAADHDRASAISHEVRDSLLHKKKKVVAVDEIERTVESVLRRHKLRSVLEAYKLVFLHLHKMKIKTVRKRDGRRQDFDPEKVFKSVCKSFRQAGEPADKRCDKLTQQAVALLEKRYAGKVVPVEEIKETIEFVLVRSKLPKVARAYILYRYM
jgi:transcriptional regulator NrdR family protein